MPFSPPPLLVLQQRYNPSVELKAVLVEPVLHYNDEPPAFAALHFFAEDEDFNISFENKINNIPNLALIVQNNFVHLFSNIIQKCND